MTILAVDNDPDRLWKLVEDIRSAFPGAVVEYTHDPQASNDLRPVDILFAAMDMRRMDGLALIEYFQNHNNPNVSAYLMLERGEGNDRDLSSNTNISILYYPVTTEALSSIAQEHCKGVME